MGSGTGIFETILVVSEEQNFTRAAERLNTNQSTVSKRVQKFEEMLGFLIFEKQKRPVQLNSNGRRLLKHVAGFCAEVDHINYPDLPDELTLHGSVRICCQNPLELCFVRKIITDFCIRYPNVNVDIITHEELRLYDNGYSGMFILRSGGNTGYSSDPVINLPSAELGVLLPTGLPLASQSSISLIDLYDYRIFISRHLYESSGPLHSFKTRHGFCFCEDLYTIEEMVSGNAGLGIVPLSENNGPHSDGLTLLHLDRHITLSRDIIYLGGGEMSVAEKAFAHMLNAGLPPMPDHSDSVR